MNGIEDQLVLSLFPGIDLLGRAFEAEGFTVVRGPDLVWGGDIKTFNPPAGRFDGIIGGPPCQAHSRMAVMFKFKRPDLIPEFARVVREARPQWFMMENVPAAPSPEVPGYVVERFALNNRDLGEVQNRERHFIFGSVQPTEYVSKLIERKPPPAAFHRCIMASGGYAPGYGSRRGCAGKDFRKHGRQSWEQFKTACVLQGLPADFLKGAPFTLKGAWTLVGNGVPLPMGRAVARAIKQALGIFDPVNPVEKVIP